MATEGAIATSFDMAKAPRSPQRWLRVIRTLSYALVLLLAAGVGAAFWLRPQPGMEQRLGGVAVPPGVAIGGPFRLTDHNGQRVTEASYRGRLMLIFFGFTHCPDICPTELQSMAEVLERLGPAAERVAPLFISIDPERDGPEELARYLALFDDRIIGLTGTAEEIASVARAFRVYYAKVHPPDASTYTMDHSSFTYLLDGEGRFLALFRHGTPPEEMAQAIRSHLGRPAGA